MASLHDDAKLLQLDVIDPARRVDHHIAPGVVLGEGDELADVHRPQAHRLDAQLELEREVVLFLLGLLQQAVELRNEERRGTVAVTTSNRRWATDLTTVWTREDGLVAVVPVIDCGDRFLLECDVTKSQASVAVLAPVLRALKTAFGSAAGVPDGLDPIRPGQRPVIDGDGVPGPPDRRPRAEPVAVDGDRLGPTAPQLVDQLTQVGVHHAALLVIRLAVIDDCDDTGPPHRPATRHRGEPVEFGGASLDSAGYDLLALITGSEGLLAVITEVTVKLTPKPQLAQVACAAFDDIEKAGAAVGAVIGALVMASLTSGMNLMGIGISYQYIVRGIILALAVIFDVATRNR